MNGFFKWFKSGTKIKRWIFLIIVGIVLVCYGINKALIIPEVIGFKELAINVLLFVFGFTFTIVGIVCIQRRTLEMMVEATDTRKDESANKVNSLIFNRKVYNQGPKVVVIGGAVHCKLAVKRLVDLGREDVGHFDYAIAFIVLAAFGFVGAGDDYVAVGEVVAGIFVLYFGKIGDRVGVAEFHRNFVVDCGEGFDEKQRLTGIFAVHGCDVVAADVEPAVLNHGVDIGAAFKVVLGGAYGDLYVA